MKDFVQNVFSRRRDVHLVAILFKCKVFYEKKVRAWKGRPIKSCETLRSTGDREKMRKHTHLLDISLSLTNTHDTHTHTPSHTLLHSNTHTHTHSISITLIHTHTRTHTQGWSNFESNRGFAPRERERERGGRKRI